MKKERTTMAITIGLVCIILVSIMFAQFKTVEETDITGIQTARETELRTMLSDWKTKYEDVATKLTETEEKINEYKQKIESNQEASELLDEELQQTNLLTGQTNVTGAGVIVVLTDNSERTIEANDLLVLVNELRLAGAEAISINDKRIVNMTEIVDVGAILVNEERIASPYIVKAIGDQTYLSSALTLKNSGYIDTYKSNGKTITMTKENNINILEYNSKKQQMQFKYAKEVEEK